MSQSNTCLKPLIKKLKTGGGGQFYFEYPFTHLATFPNNFNHWQTKSKIQRLKIQNAKPKEGGRFEDSLSYNVDLEALENVATFLNNFL